MDDRPDQTAAESPEEARLLADLRGIAGRLDPVPAELAEAARASFALRRLDAELAELVEAAGAGELAAVRGHGGPTRLLQFATEGLTVDLEVVPAGRARRLVGQLVPPGPATVELRHAGGATSFDADEHGQFATPEFPAGPMSLRVHRPAGPEPRLVETAWLGV